MCESISRIYLFGKNKQIWKNEGTFSEKSIQRSYYVHVSLTLKYASGEITVLGFALLVKLSVIEPELKRRGIYCLLS